MKFNSIFLIIFCLLQVLKCESIEQSLNNTIIKTLKYAKEFHEDFINLYDKEIFYNICINYPPLTPDNIQFKFDDFGLLHIKFVDLIPIIKGKKQQTSKLRRNKASFSAKLNHFIWEQVFVVTKKELENGKIDLKFKLTEESDIKFNIFEFEKSSESFGTVGSSYSNVSDGSIKSKIKTMYLNPVKNELKKISQLILETLQSNLK